MSFEKTKYMTNQENNQKYIMVGKYEIEKVTFYIYLGEQLQQEKLAKKLEINKREEMSSI